ncbi:MAG: sulfotransferase [Pseudomonadota bacterium]
MANTRFGPDFISIGMPSSGTRWLYDNLQAHKDVHMPYIKELHFLDRGIREHTVKNRTREANQQDRDAAQIDPRDRAFLDRYLHGEVVPELRSAEQEYLKHSKEGRIRESLFIPQEHHFEFYDSLFRCYFPKKTGDITPGYFRLPEKTISAFHNRYPFAKYLLIIRNPVLRLVSKLNKRVHKGVLPVEDAKRRILNPMGDSNRDLSRTIEKWMGIVGRDAVLTITLEAVASDPIPELQKIFSFLDLSADASEISEDLKGNRKQDRIPKLLSDLDTNNLREWFAEEIERCQALVGGATLEW